MHDSPFCSQGDIENLRQNLELTKQMLGENIKALREDVRDAREDSRITRIEMTELRTEFGSFRQEASSNRREDAADRKEIMEAIISLGKRVPEKIKDSGDTKLKLVTAMLGFLTHPYVWKAAVAVGTLLAAAFGISEFTHKG